MDWYWIVVRDQGRSFLHDTPYKRYKAAERVNDERYGGRGRIEPLATSDRVEAARALREQLAREATPNWGKNFRHVKESK